MALRRPKASYPPQMPTQSQEPVYRYASLKELMDSIFINMPNLTDAPKEVLFQNYLYAPLM